jgi:RHS repeat-associated protein
VTDEAGETVWTSEYTPFGDPYLAEGDWPMLRSSLVRMDEDTGLYYFNARWYDPDTGRFVEEDPIQSEWLGYFNEKSRGRTEGIVKAILEEEAKAENDGKKVELVSEPRNLDEIDGNNWYSSENRAERERKSDVDIESQSMDDTDHKFENENGVNWYWYVENNPVMYIDPDGTTVCMTLTVGISGYACVGGSVSATYVFDDHGNKGILINTGLGFGIEAGVKDL